MERGGLCARMNDDGTTEALLSRRKSLSYRGVVDNGELCWMVFEKRMGGLGSFGFPKLG